MSSARRSRAAARRQGDAATWPAPATEGARARSGPAPPYHHAVSAARCARAMPAAGINGAPSLFPGRENLSGAEGILSVRLSETLDSGARASRLKPNVTPAPVQPANQAFSVLRQADGNANTGRGGLVSAAAGISRQTISYHSGGRPACVPLPALGVRTRTVGDFFRGRSVHREGGGWCSANDVQ